MSEGADLDSREVTLTVVAVVVLVNALLVVALVSLSGMRQNEADQAADD